MPNNHILDLGDVSQVQQMAFIAPVFYDIAGDFIVQLDGEVILMHFALAFDQILN